VAAARSSRAGKIVEIPGGQGGPDLGIYFRSMRLGSTVQAGYGNAGGFGQISFIKQFDFVESGLF